MSSCIFMKSSVSAAPSIVLQPLNNPRFLHVYKQTSCELHLEISMLFSTTATSCGDIYIELLTVYMEDNRHGVPSNSCCSTLLPAAGI